MHSRKISETENVDLVGTKYIDDFCLTYNDDLCIKELEFTDITQKNGEVNYDGIIGLGPEKQNYVNFLCVLQLQRYEIRIPMEKK